MYTPLRYIHPFLHSSPFNPTTKILRFTMLFNWQDISKVPLPAGASTPHVIHILWTHSTQNPKLYLDRFKRFCTAHSRQTLHFTTCFKTQLKN